MTWLPFGSDQLEVQIETGVSNGLYHLEIRCVQSKVGDIARFCYLVGSNILWVATPVDDDGIPVYPAVNEEGATRCDKIRISTDKREIIEETSNGLLADLDEYIRSKRALLDLATSETYVI